MKLNEIKTLAIELEEWALKDGKKGGWKKIVPLITAHHYGDLLESLDGITRHPNDSTQQTGAATCSSKSWRSYVGSGRLPGLEHE